MITMHESHACQTMRFHNKTIFLLCCFLGIGCWIFMFESAQPVVLQNIEDVGIEVPRFQDGDTDDVIKVNSELLRQYVQRIVKNNKTHVDRNNRLTIDDIYLDAGFQPEVEVDFPFVDRNKPRIPHIIHQIWLSSPEVSSVPSMFIDNIKTFLDNNPKWTYFLWTNDTAREFLHDQYPHLLGFFDRLPRIVSRGDMLRYVVLHAYGGVYVDLDTVNFRSLDRITMKYPCLLVPEPFEHAVLWYSQPYIVINAIMMCRAKHPFFAQVVDYILSRDFIDNEVQSLGPGFLTVQYRVYNNLSDERQSIDLTQDSTTPYFYKGDIPVTHDDGIYIPNTRYFMDSPSPELKSQVDKTCASSDISNMSRRMCVTIEKRGYQRKPGKFTFIDHLWSHTWGANKLNDEYTYTSIRDLTNNIVTYDDVKKFKGNIV